MTTTLEKPKDKQIMRPLEDIPPLIREHLDYIETQKESFEALTLDDKKEIGLLLNEAKAQLKHGQWGPWLRKHFKWSQSTAWEYMRFAQISSRGNFGTMVDAIREHVKADHERPPKWREEVKELVERARKQASVLKEHHLTRHKERELERKLGLKLINIGYKILSVELHPDKSGGSHDAMSRLNSVRARLRQAA